MLRDAVLRIRNRQKLSNTSINGSDRLDAPGATPLMIPRRGRPHRDGKYGHVVDYRASLGFDRPGHQTASIDDGQADDLRSSGPSA
jgi:hypothetical protein